MTDLEPNPHELALRLAVLEERMKTMQAEYKTDIARLAEDAAKRDLGYRTDIARIAEDAAKRDAEAAKRETRLIVTIAGLLAVAVAILGFIN